MTRYRVGCIYLLMNVVTGKCYVGQTTGLLESRFKRHVKDAVNGSDVYLHRSIRKYGADNFVKRTLQRCTEPLLDAFERHYIQQLGTLAPHGYNLTKGGDGGGYGRRSKRERKLIGKKIAASNAWRDQSNEKKEFYETTEGVACRARISKALTGRRLSDKVRANHSKGLHARYSNVEAHEQTSRALLRHHASAAGASTRSALSKAAKLRAANGQYFSAEARKRISARAVEQWATPELREHITKARKAAGYSVGSDTRAKISTTLKATYAAHPEILQNLSAKLTGRQMPRHSEFMKARWDAWRLDAANGVVRPAPNGRLVKA